MENDVLKLKEDYHETYTTSLKIRLALRLRMLTLVPLVELSSRLGAKPPLPMLSGKVLMERLKHLKKSFQNLIHSILIVQVVPVRQRRRMFWYQII